MAARWLFVRATPVGTVCGRAPAAGETLVTCLCTPGAARGARALAGVDAAVCGRVVLIRDLPRDFALFRARSAAFSFASFISRSFASLAARRFCSSFSSFALRVFSCAARR